jgi:hypothetical protein
MVRKLIQRVFPRRPVLGIALSVLLICEGAAVVNTVVEGTWKYQQDSTKQWVPTYNVWVYYCHYKKDDDYSQYSQGTETWNPHRDMYSSDTPDHHQHAWSVHVMTGCPAAPTTGYQDLLLYHKFAKEHNGTH